MRRHGWLPWVVVCGVGLVAAAYGRGLYRQHIHDRELAQRLPDLALAAALPPCGPADQASLNLLVLGQSNAASHGEPFQSPSEEMPLEVWVPPHGCVLSKDPLPGGSGSGGSIWQSLPQALESATGQQRRLSFAIVAVDSTSITDWTDADGPLGRHLAQRLEALSAVGWRPHLILWQQGEADALQGTTRERYVEGVERLREALRSKGITAPMLLAKSTFCAGRRDDAIRAAIDDLQARNPGFRPGPDTDTLDAAHFRFGSCHFSQRGLTQAAALWAKAIRTVLQPNL